MAIFTSHHHKNIIHECLFLVVVRVGELHICIYCGEFLPSHASFYDTRFSVDNLQLCIDNNLVMQVSHVKFLGVYIDENLS